MSTYGIGHICQWRPPICESNMATPSAALLDRLEKQGIPKSKRKLQKHLRSAGLAYISRTGKLIPAKQVAGMLNPIFYCLHCDI